MCADKDHIRQKSLAHWEVRAIKLVGSIVAAVVLLLAVYVLWRRKRPGSLGPQAPDCPLPTVGEVPRKPSSPVLVPVPPVSVSPTPDLPHATAPVIPSAPAVGPEPKSPPPNQAPEAPSVPLIPQTPPATPTSDPSVLRDMQSEAQAKAPQPTMPPAPERLPDSEPSPVAVPVPSVAVPSPKPDSPSVAERLLEPVPAPAVAPSLEAPLAPATPAAPGTPEAAELLPAPASAPSTVIPLGQEATKTAERTLVVEPGISPEPEKRPPSVSAPTSPSLYEPGAAMRPQTEPIKEQIPHRGEIAQEKRQKPRRSAGRRQYTPPSRKQPSMVGTAPGRPRQERLPNHELRRDLKIAVRLSVDKQNICRVSLLPERREGMPERIDVVGTGNPPQLHELQDDWYRDLIVPDMGDILAGGAYWRPCDDVFNGTSWSLSGRQVHVLGLSDDIGWYVSVPRLIVGEKHAVICTTGIFDEVNLVLTQAGVDPNKYRLFDATSGTPQGWVALTDVCPASGLRLTPQTDILNVLRPDSEATVHLRGGIRLRRSSWLVGSPPKITLAGPSTSTVCIDGKAATRQADGGHVTSSYADEGTHVVTLGSSNKVVSYEIIKPAHKWALFVTPNGNEEYGPGSSINHPICSCGPVVVASASRGNLETVRFVPVPRGYLAVGQKAGEIVTTVSGRGGTLPCSVCASTFRPVWLLPANPFVYDKNALQVTLMGDMTAAPSVDLKVKLSARPRHEVLRWARAILDCSRKHLRVSPDTPEVRALWLAYRAAAKLARRRFKC